MTPYDGTYMVRVVIIIMIVVMISGNDCDDAVYCDGSTM